MQACQAGVHLSPSHIYRDDNTWADDLVNDDLKDFDPSLRLHAQEPQWVLLDKLIKMGSPEGLKPLSVVTRDAASSPLGTH